MDPKRQLKWILVSADEQNSRRLPDAAKSEWRIQSGKAVVTVVAVLMKI